MENSNSIYCKRVHSESYKIKKKCLRDILIHNSWKRAMYLILERKFIIIYLLDLFPDSVSEKILFIILLHFFRDK